VVRSSTTHTSHQSSLLARSVAPPPKPEPIQDTTAEFVWGILMLILLGTWGAIGMAIFSVARVPIDYVFSCIVMGLLLLPLGWCVVRLSRFGQKRSESAESLYNARKINCENKIRIWSRLHYCNRCDMISDPETGRCALSSSLSAFYNQDLRQ
jgi:hypothetical protein